MIIYYSILRQLFHWKMAPTAASAINRTGYHSGLLVFSRMSALVAISVAPWTEVARIIIGLISQTPTTPATTPTATAIAGKVQSVMGPKFSIIDQPKATPTVTKTANFSMVIPNIPRTRPPAHSRMSCQV